MHYQSIKIKDWIKKEIIYIMWSYKKNPTLHVNKSTLQCGRSGAVLKLAIEYANLVSVLILYK